MIKLSRKNYLEYKLRCRSQMDIAQLTFSSELCQVQKNKTKSLLVLSTREFPLHWYSD